MVPDSSSSASSKETRDNNSSAEAKVSTTSSLPDSSSNIRGLIKLATPDGGGISRNLLRHQKHRWGECTSTRVVVSSGISPRFAQRRSFSGACGTCGAYGHMSRPCRAARMHANVIPAVPPAMPWPPPAFAGAGGVGVPRPGGWLPQ